MGNHVNKINYISHLPVEIIYQMLFSMHYKDIISFSLSRAYGIGILNDDLFWMKKLDYDFGSVENGSIRYSPSNIIGSRPDRRGIDIYRRWISETVFVDNEAMFVDNEAMFVDNETVFVDNEAMYAAAMCERCIQIGHNDTAHWLLIKYNSHIMSLSKDMVMACINAENIEILNLLDKKYLPRLNDKTMIKAAARSDKVKLLEWLISAGYKPDILTAQLACECGHLFILQCLARGGFPIDATVVDIASTLGHIHILEWLSQIGVVSSREMVELVVKRGDYLNILRSFDARGLAIMDSQVANIAIIYKRNTIIQWLKQKGITDSLQVPN